MVEDEQNRSNSEKILRCIKNWLYSKWNSVRNDESEIENYGHYRQEENQMKKTKEENPRRRKIADTLQT